MFSNAKSPLHFIDIVGDKDDPPRDKSLASSCCPLVPMGKNQSLIGLMPANWRGCKMTLPNRDEVTVSSKLAGEWAVVETVLAFCTVYEAE